ncbi:hypothetical protein FJZ48_01775 [Candidatus Uhrbacteria bacterium]|nr:hypothetical protein [Candidatus Uhrbacteria bacterium]
MPHLPIELEIRGEIKSQDIPDIILTLKKAGFRFVNETRRTSLMSFGDITSIPRQGMKTTTTQVDVRCRVTNGKPEVVAKIGLTHVANRTEITQPVSSKDVFLFARMFGSMGFFSKVGSKRTKNFKKGDVIISLVESPSGLAYIEIEKMSDRTREKKDLKELTTLAHQIGIRLWNTRKQFLDFCDQLTLRDDWEFHGTDKDIKRLKQEIKQTGSGKR